MKEALNKTLLLLLFIVSGAANSFGKDLLQSLDTLSGKIDSDFRHEVEHLDSVYPILSELDGPDPETDSLADYDTDRNWWHLLKKGKLNLADTTVQYPKFLKFCVDVYNWGDHFFNSYNPEYVVGTGHRWKARLVNENWTDSYALHFRREHFNIRMLSNLNANIGAYLHYMAVSVGYSIDMNSVFGGQKNDHYKFETNFNCALFNFDLSYTRNKGSFVRQMTGYHSNRLVKEPFTGTSMGNFNVSLYYFFNNKKYSQGAAYNFSKFQRKSAGSWMAGLTYSNLNIAMDFSSLPEEMHKIYQNRLEPEYDHLKIHYHSYCLLVGYGYNWVFHPKWLFNATVMPSIGVNHCYEDTSEGSGTQFALGVHGRASLTYNHRSMFVALQAKITGNWYTSPNLSLFNAIEFFSFNVGVRF